MGARWRNGAHIIAALCGIGVCFIISYATWHIVNLSWRFNSTSNQYMGTPLYIPQIVMPVAYGLLGLGFLEEVLRRAFGRNRPDTPSQFAEGREP
jgi:TRAP-type C4-dicarboxylate transport system permease small subunit